MLWALRDAIVDGYSRWFDAPRTRSTRSRTGDRATRSGDAPAGLPAPPGAHPDGGHIVAPSREVFAQLTSREFRLIGPESVFFFRDVYDHLIRLNEELDLLRELVAGSLEIYLSTINNNLSRIMKRLTGVTVLIAGIGAVGGIFGMSEAAGALAGAAGPGFYIVVAATLIATVVGVLVLRRIDWL